MISPWDWYGMNEREIGLERIQNLFEMAESIYEEDPELSHRYVEIALRISQRVLIEIPKKWKRRYCDSCHSFLKPGRNCRVRTRSLRVCITCLECGEVMRIPYEDEKKE